MISSFEENTKMKQLSFLCLFYLLMFCPRVLGLKGATVCGRSIVDESLNRIAGGRSAIQGEFPWQVSVQTNEVFGEFEHVCGGTLISESFILTAAHCVNE